MRQTVALILVLLLYVSCSKTPIAPVDPPPVNSKPVLDSLYMSADEISAEDTLHLIIMVHDEDGDSLSVWWRASAGYFSNATAFRTAWIPPKNALAGTQYTIHVSVDDGQDSITVSRLVTIGLRPNISPQIDSLRISSVQVEPGQSIQLHVYASDADGDVLTYHWTSAKGTFSDPGAAETSWLSPADAEAGSRHTLSLTVSDGRDSVTASLYANIIEPPNTPPIIESMTLSRPDVTPGGTLKLQSIASDADGDSLSYHWSSPSGNLLSAEQPVTDWIFPFEAEIGSTANVSLTVSDGEDSVTLSKQITVVAGITLSGHAYYRGTKMPLAGVSVKLLNLSATTDEEGFYQMAFVPGPDDYQLQGAKSGFDNYTAKISVSEVNNIFDIPMNSDTETGIISGLFYTIDEIKLDGIRMVLVNPDLSVSEITATSVADGTYRLTHIPPGERLFYIENITNENQILADTLKLEITTSEQVVDRRIKIYREIYREVGTDNQRNWTRTDCNILPDSYQIFGLNGLMKMTSLLNIPSDAEKLTMGFYKIIASLGFQNCHYGLFNENDEGDSFTFASGNRTKEWSIHIFGNAENFLGKNVYIQFWTNNRESQFNIFEIFLSCYW